MPICTKKFITRSVSAITPIKKLATEIGWDGTKDVKSRKFLSDLKRVVVEYNDYPTTYLLHEYQEFLMSSAQILFMHIREIDEIKKMKGLIPSRCVTLLIRNTDAPEQWGNDSDDCVEQYDYDYYYDNIKPLDQVEIEFRSLIAQILCDKS